MNLKTNNDKISFKEQLQIFNELGFKLNKGVTLNDILELAGQIVLDSNPYALYKHHKRLKNKFKEYPDDVTIKLGLEKIEKTPFIELYFILGDEIERRSYPITNQCWYLDAYILEEHRENISVFIHKNLKRITNNDFNLKSITNLVESKKNRPCDITLELNKWANRLLYEITELVNSNSSSSKLTALLFDTDNPANGLVIGWSTNKEKEDLTKKTRLNIKWLQECFTKY